MGSMVNELKQFFGFSEEETNEEEKKDVSLKIKPFKGSLVNAQNSRPFASSEIKVVEPKIYEDSLTIAGYLRENKPVLVNLKYLDSDAGKRLIDFICGTAYAINGHMLKVGEHIFLFTPNNVLIDSQEEKSTLDQGIQHTERDMLFNKVSNGN